MVPDRSIDARVALLRPALSDLHTVSLLDEAPASLRRPGVYAWYFSEIPEDVPINGCHQAHGYTLLYVGIAPKQTVGITTKPSERTLLHRLRDHFRGNGAGSTLRLTLGCLLADRLNISLRRVGSGNRFTFTNNGEQKLDGWIADHARVVWTAVESPWEVEHELLIDPSIPLPLNLSGNQHPFVKSLQGIRAAAKAKATLMPIIMDNGGPRRVQAIVVD